MNEAFIARCYELAEEARAAGNHPFGALLERRGQVLVEARNTVLTEGDVTRHAELVLVSTAVREYDALTLAACTLYSSTEPCAMCAGAIYWAGLGRIVYGCSGALLATIAGSDFAVPCREILTRGSRRVEVVGPIQEEIGARQHREYWQS